VTGLVKPGHVSLTRAIELWTEAPRRVFGLPAVELAQGSDADLVLIDPPREWTVDPTVFHSLGRNTPFGGGSSPDGCSRPGWRAGSRTPTPRSRRACR
jgi:dihydroorotase